MQIWSGIPEGENIDFRTLLQTAAHSLDEPASVLQRGGLVAFPTETVYGLGANAWNEQAVLRIFLAKRRPADNPLIVHIARAEDLHMVTPADFSANETMQALMAKFWPGPLTILVPAGPQIAPSVHPGLTMVGVRVPAHPIAQALIALAGCPIAAPSANRSGKPSPTSVTDVVEDFSDEIVGVIEGGACAVGMESTVIEVQSDQIVIYRPGGITLADLQEVAGLPVVYDAYLLAETNSKQQDIADPKAPGMKYRHYAPNAEVTVWQGSPADIKKAIRTQIERQTPASLASVGIICPQEWAADLLDTAQGTDVHVVSLPLVFYAKELGRQLYGQLRRFDRLGMNRVWIIAPPDEDSFTPTVLNRLRKAAEGRIIVVDSEQE